MFLLNRRNVVGVLIGILGAVLLLLGEWTPNPGYTNWIPIIVTALGLTPPLSDVVALVFIAIQWLAFYGAWTILVGCLFVLLGRIRIGANLMSIGAGVSLMNLIWRILQVWPLGLVQVSEFANLFQGLAGVGVIVSVIAQEIVKIPKKKPPAEPKPPPEVVEEPVTPLVPEEPAVPPSEPEEPVIPSETPPIQDEPSEEESSEPES